MSGTLAIDQKVNIEGTIYKVIGIDTYKLSNIYEQIQEWVSYTLIDPENEQNRIWLGYGFAGKFFIKQWLIGEEEFKQHTANLPLNADYTGVANITFEGNQGYSVPNSEIIWYNDSAEGHDFFVIERFLEFEGHELKTSKSYYHMMKILKNVALLEH